MWTTVGQGAGRNPMQRSGVPLTAGGIPRGSLLRDDGGVRARDPHDDVSAALEWMVGEDGAISDLDAHTLETFLWYGLPTKWGIEPDDRLQLCVGLATALQAAGRSELAGRCTDAQTAAVHEAFDDSVDAGMTAFRVAADRSPSTPPDLAPAGDDPGLAWGPIMGMVEASARAAVGEALGEAWEAGRLTPGTRGWRGAAADRSRGAGPASQRSADRRDLPRRSAGRAAW